MSIHREKKYIDISKWINKSKAQRIPITYYSLTSLASIQFKADRLQMIVKKA